MAYTAWSVVFGEQPTAAKWNQLGANDAGFKDGTNIDNLAITNAKLAGGITGDKLATTALLLGIVQFTANFTTSNTSPQLITGATLNITVPAGGRSVKLTLFTRNLSNNTVNMYGQMGIWDGSVGGTRIGGASNRPAVAGGDMNGICIAVVTPAAGAKTYTASLNAAGGGTAMFGAVSSEPAFFMAELI